MTPLPLTTSPSPPSASASRPIKVFYLTGHLGTGGSEVHLLRLVQGLDKTRIPCEVVVLWSDGIFHPSMVKTGIPIHDLRLGPGPMNFLAGTMRLRALIRKHKPDVLHSYSFTCNLMATLAAKPGRSPKLVTTRRGNEFVRRRHVVYRLTNPLVDRVVCVSKATERFSRKTEGLARPQSVVVPNGLDLTPFLALRRHTGPIRALGTVGRLRAVKGTDLLVDAWKSLQLPNLGLRIAGPAYQDWGYRFLQQHTDTPGLEFVDAVLDVPAFLSSIDLFVLPSRSEGMSNALIEAMAAGLPIVATDVGGNRETLGDGAAGLLVPPKAGAIAEAIQRLIDHPEEAQVLGARARERAVREYALETMIGRYEAFYEQLTHEPGAG